jgi:ssRNA-specific RNase YbeY (16S rRNA maturation enzyme)
MRTLNRTWRQVDRATDVLSFPAIESAEGQEGRRTGRGAGAQRRRSAGRGAGAEGRRSAGGGAGAKRRSDADASHLGDIVIATGVAKRQARDAGHAEATEWRVLALHGLLHLVGYDHERDAGEMARIEARLRRRGGLAAGLIERVPGAAKGRALRMKTRAAARQEEGAAFRRAIRAGSARA